MRQVQLAEKAQHEAEVQQYQTERQVELAEKVQYQAELQQYQAERQVEFAEKAIEETTAKINALKKKKAN